MHRPRAGRSARQASGENSDLIGQALSDDAKKQTPQIHGFRHDARDPFPGMAPCGPLYSQGKGPWSPAACEGAFQEDPIIPTA
jgi:hypothetical protein